MKNLYFLIIELKYLATKIIINFNCAFFWHFTIQLELALEQLTFSGQLLCIGRSGI